MREHKSQILICKTGTCLRHRRPIHTIAMQSARPAADTATSVKTTTHVNPCSFCYCYGLAVGRSSHEALTPLNSTTGSNTDALHYRQCRTGKTRLLVTRVPSDILTHHTFSITFYLDTLNTAIACGPDLIISNFLIFTIIATSLTVCSFMMFHPYHIV